MKIFHCSCGNKLYFENSLCLSCHREVGWCPVCNGMHDMEPDGMGKYMCTNHDPNIRVSKCFNYATYNVCNRMIVNNGQPEVLELCSYCQLTCKYP